jgi:hypothetical protein
MAMAAMPGADDDISLFWRTIPEVEDLIARDRGQPSFILADQGYIGMINSETVHLVRPHKEWPGRFRGQGQLLGNRVLARNPIVVENFFGHLTRNFHLLVRRWANAENLGPGIFEMCCALVNFDCLRSSVSGRDVEAREYPRAMMMLIAEGLAQQRHPDRDRSDREIASEVMTAELFQADELEPGEQQSRDKSQRLANDHFRRQIFLNIPLETMQVDSLGVHQHAFECNIEEDGASAKRIDRCGKIGLPLVHQLSWNAASLVEWTWLSRPVAVRRESGTDE